jgi:hypothetical protein
MPNAPSANATIAIGNADPRRRRKNDPHPG